MKRALLISLVLASAWGFASDTVRVRLFSDKNLSTAQIRVTQGHYVWVALSADGSLIDTVSDAHQQRGWLHDIRPAGGELALNRKGLSLGRYRTLRMIPATDSAWFLIKGVGRERVYEGTLEIRELDGRLILINEVDIPAYIAGVVESEGGHSTEYEYFRAQAVLARTWLMANWNKHIDEGYNVKDDVTSQAYFSMAYLQNSDRIRKAVASIADTVLADDRGEYVLGVFHSNSGGQTANSEDAWSRPIEYLRSVVDSFSLEGSKAHWRVEIDKETFVRYVASRLGVASTDANFRLALLEYDSPVREGYFEYVGKKLKWRDVRAHFGLRSAWFSVRENGNKVILTGKGFGHGVGMSQEGAMVMASRGYDYRQILQFYFRGTRLLSSDQMSE